MSLIQLRKEIDDYSRSCELLIVAAESPEVSPFTAEEIQWIAYYAREMTNLAKRLPRGPKPGIEQFLQRRTKKHQGIG